MARSHYIIILTFRARTVYKMFEKKQAILLYWFAEHKQTDTFWWQKLDYFYQKFSTEFN